MQGFGSGLDPNPDRPRSAKKGKKRNFMFKELFGGQKTSMRY
jgi:hypothetical protein